MIDTLTLPRALPLLSPLLPTLSELTFTAQLQPITDTDEVYGCCEHRGLAVFSPTPERKLLYGRVRGVLDLFSFTWNGFIDFASSTLFLTLCTNDTLIVNGVPLVANQSQPVDDGDIIELQERNSAIRIRFLYRKTQTFFNATASTVYKVVNMAGQGGFGSVYTCRNTGNSRRVAVKTVAAPVDEYGAQDHTQEVKTLRQLWEAVKKDNKLFGLGDDWYEPPIVRMRDCWITGTIECIVMDLALGDFFHLVHPIPRDTPASAPSKSCLPELSVLSAAKDIFEGLRFVHAQELVHCDIKPNNFLLYGPLNEHGMYRVVLADFGQCTSTLELDLNAAIELPFGGTPGYLAPEIASYIYKPELDVWAAGVTIYYLFTGFSPFESADASQVQALSDAGEHWQRLETTQGVSAEAISFLRGCLETEWTKRFTSNTAFCHDWLRGRPLPSLPDVDADATFTPVSYNQPLIGLDHEDWLALLDAIPAPVEHEAQRPAEKRAHEQLSGSQPEQGDQKRVRNVALS